MALDALLTRCRAWSHRHLLGTKHLSPKDISLVLDVAEELTQLKDAAPLKGRRLFNFFVEPSTRTKTSFSLAAKRLGADVVDFSPAGSSLTKGESLKDTARTIESMGVAFTVIRHSASGAPAFLSRLVESAVINAGDGTNEHPTQALLDLLTMRQRMGKITGLRVALVGDILHSRVARSNLWALQKLGNQVTLVGPSTLVPRDLDAPVSHDFDKALREHDVVMMLRLQLERQAAGLFPSTAEYVRFFGLTRERLATLENGTIIMHPGPMNRGLEISAEAADSSRSVILNQVTNGVAVRAAVLLLSLAGECVILIKNAKPFDVLIDGGKIKKTGKITEKADQVIDAKGCLVVPGLIDMHVHFREPGREDKETIATGSAAAVAGGFTSVAVMANSGRVCDDAVGVVYVNVKGREAGGTNVFAVGAVTKGLKGEELAELGKMSEEGAVAFSDDGMPITNSDLMRRALEYSKMFDKPILSHCEDASLTKGFVMNEGPVSAKLGLRGYPNAAEAAMAARDCYLAALTGGRVHICHVSAAETVDVVRRAKKAGIRVTAEAAPHHLMLTDDALKDYESKYKMNPPLRTKADVDAVLEGVVDGTIDAIASDHAPHTAEEKEQELAACPNGIIGLETTLGVILSLKKLPVARAIEAMTEAPAAILGLKGKGTLKAGADADVTVIDPKAAWTVDPSSFRSKGRSTPYEKMKLTGRAKHVIVGGRVCF